MPRAKLSDNFDPGRFLRDCWQKAPLQLADALVDFKDPISLEQLMALSFEDDSDARLVFTESAGTPWAVRYGPFAPQDFESLPQYGWTLLVRHVDKLLPEVAALRATFRFIPDWRIDDVMVSYAVEEGSVGPHIDQYDVFLLQGDGRRRWEIDPDADTATRDDTEMEVLKAFHASREWIQECGDLLYLPPGIAHFGTAIDPGFTYSIGFRAPSSAELLAGWFEHLLADAKQDVRYQDPDLDATTQPGKLTRSALDQIESLLKKGLSAEDDAMQRWFGGWITADDEVGSPEPPSKPIGLERLQRQLAANRHLIRHPKTRIAYIEKGDRAWLFVNGTEFRVSLGLASKVGDRPQLGYQNLRGLLSRPEDADALLQLINAGYLLFKST